MKKGTAYFGNRYRQHYQADLQTMISAGCNIVLHTFSEEDQKYYKQSVSDLIADSKAAGLEVYIDPWGVAKVFGGEPTSYWLLANYNEWQQISSGERRATACFNSPLFRKFMLDWVDDACGLGADVMFIDEPHWYSPEWFLEQDHWGCCCYYCQERFATMYGYTMPKNNEVVIRQFKDTIIVEFIDLLSKRASDHGVATSICLLPSEEPQSLDLYEKVAALPCIDIIGTDPYWVLADKVLPVEETVQRWGKVIRELADKHSKQSELWLQNFHLPREQMNNLSVAIDNMKNLNVDRLMAWGFYGSRGMSSLACTDCEQVWQKFMAINN